MARRPKLKPIVGCPQVLLGGSGCFSFPTTHFPQGWQLCCSTAALVQPGSLLEKTWPKDLGSIGSFPEHDGGFCTRDRPLTHSCCFCLRDQRLSELLREVFWLHSLSGAQFGVGFGESHGSFGCYLYMKQKSPLYTVVMGYDSQGG